MFKSMFYRVVQDNIMKWGPRKTLRMLGLSGLSFFSVFMLSAELIPNDSDMKKIEKENECYE